MLPWERLAPGLMVLPQGMARCGALPSPVGPLKMRLRQKWGWVANDVSRTCVFSFKRDLSVSRLLLMGQVQALVGRDNSKFLLSPDLVSGPISHMISDHVALGKLINLLETTLLHK